MNGKEPPENQGLEPQHQPHRVRLPGFLIDEEIGLGNVVRRIAYAMGIRPCSGCEKRAAALNRWIHFSSRRR
jgi:hypothetical protein